MDQLAHHFLVWKSFNNYIYKKTLTSEDIVNNGNEKWIDEVAKIEKGQRGYIVKEGVLVNKKCIFMEKNGVKYILPTEYQKFLTIKRFTIF